MKLLHQAGKVINQKYRILGILGKGGVGITYLAKDLHNNKNLALKVLSLRRINNWKKIELFERESQILSQLNHPAIPCYLDCFQIQTDKDNYFYIAQQLAPGKSLTELIESGWHPDESEVRDIAIQILDILIYLHSFSPPVIHRDIKPQNIISGNNRKVFLVDFGAVADTYHNTVTGGSTVIGTFGYMAPEQFRGKALPSTDLYGLGTTLLYLLTGKSPADLPQKHLKIDFRSQINVSQNFADWLDKMVEPVAEERFHDAEVALAVLRSEKSLDNYPTQKPRRPKDTPISLRKNEEKLQIEIPPGKFPNYFRLFLAMLILLGNGLLLLTFLAIFQHLSLSNIVPSFIVIGYLYIYFIFGLEIIDNFLITPLSRIKFTISRYDYQHKFCFQRWVLFQRFQTLEGHLSEKLFKDKFYLIKYHLTSKEYKWLKEEIHNFVNDDFLK